MASVGVRVEPRVSLWREGKVGCAALACKPEQMLGVHESPIPVCIVGW